MAQEVQAVLSQTDLRASLTTLGFDVTYEGPEELRQRIRRELVMWSRVVREAGIKPE
jgi:tripartite-type tricarboxylate transporter receptor subunit TctC